MINGSLADNVLDSLDQFPLVVVGAAGHPMSTIALLANRMGHEVEIRDASHQVAIHSERAEMFGFVTPATALIRSVLVGPAGIIDARNEMEEEEGEEEEEEGEGEGEGEDAGAHHAAQPPALAPVAQQDAHMPNLAGADVAARARAPARKFMRYPLDRVPIALEFNSHHQVSMLLVSLGTLLVAVHHMLHHLLGHIYRSAEIVPRREACFDAISPHRKIIFLPPI